MRIFRNRLVQLVHFVVVLSILTGNSLAQDRGSQQYDSPEIDAKRAWETVRQAQQLVGEHHYFAPTRQQMYLAATQLVYRINHVPAPSDLPEAFSVLVKTEDFEQLFLKAWRQFHLNETFDAERTLTGAVNALLRCSDIKSGRFLSAKEFRVANSLKENQYVGIGIQLATEDELPMITKAYYGGAAQKAGARSNDLILEVDGVKSHGRTLHQVVDDLRGLEGTKVTVKLQNLSSQKVREYEMVRATIPLPTVEAARRNDDGSWALELSEGSGVAYLKFSSVVGSTAAEFTQLAHQVKRESLDRVVLDFRSVGLSDLHHVVMLADTLLDNETLGTVHYKGDTEKIKTRPGTALPERIQIAVIAPTEIDGPLFFLLSNLKNRLNVAFVGQQVSSAGVATKLVEMPDGLGAVESMPCAICRPRIANGFDPGSPTVPPLTRQRLFGQPRYEFQPDVLSTQRENGLIQAAVGALQSEVGVQISK